MPVDPKIEISVIVPCLNEEKTLPLFLKSLTQDQKISMILAVDPLFEPRQFPFELVVVDGGSSDGSRDLIDTYRAWMKITGIIDYTRNLGFVRNRGAAAARGEIFLFTNSDVILPKNLLKSIWYEFAYDSDLVVLSGRTVPINAGILSVIAYTAFDFLRWLGNKVGKFSPSGNLLAIRNHIYSETGGFKMLRVNEDGEYGSRLKDYAKSHSKKVKFMLNIHVWHSAKRFRRNPLRALLFYLYVFGNFSSILKRILKPIELKSSREIVRR
jgi:glycosyltransferase involved in cell wall biosynthesis